jgi:hypothetical protein
MKMIRAIFRLRKKRVKEMWKAHHRIKSHFCADISLSRLGEDILLALEVTSGLQQR